MNRIDADSMLGPELVRLALERGAREPRESTRKRWAEFCRAYAGEGRDAVAIAARSFVDSLPVEERLPLVRAVAIALAPSPVSSPGGGSASGPPGTIPEGQ